MEIITKRLKLVCISKKMYQSLLVTNKYDNMICSNNWLSSESRKIIETDLLDYEGVSELMKWSVWAVALNDTNQLIGSAGFKGIPCIDGNIEICYEINEEYQKKGYGLEAVEALLTMAQNDVRVENIFAECLIDNEGSIRILEKSGFCKISSDEEFLYWEKK